MQRAALLAGARRATGPAVTGLEHMTEQLYVPVARWLTSAMARTPRRPFVLGVSGPQGSGKSTLAAALVEAVRADGQRALALSTDDLYLTRQAQIGVAETWPACPYLQQRGYPGTHDVVLGERVLEDLCAGRATQLPRYDKSAHAGQGDRGRSETVQARQHLVVFEGWTLGFTPALDVELAMQPVNQLLAGYAAWNRAPHAWLVMRAANLADVVAWRVESERNRAARGEDSMGEAGARRYIERCLPAYRTYLPELWAKTSALRVTLGPERRPLTRVA